MISRVWTLLAVAAIVAVLACAYFRRASVPPTVLPRAQAPDGVRGVVAKIRAFLKGSP